MKALLYFFIRNAHWFLALFLVAISFYLVFSFNAFQRSVFLSSANVVVGNIYTASSRVESLFRMRRDNSLLMEQIVQLQQELYSIQLYLEENRGIDSSEIQAFVSSSLADDTHRFSFIPARVVYNTTTNINNYVTINKGSIHGIRQNMGVVSTNGVVGVVANVSSHFSVVLPIINPRFGLGARLQYSQNTGSISWDGRNIRQAHLTQLPRHEVFIKGDTVITSFSRIFPQNLIIGFVSEQTESRDGNFNTFTIELATNFHSLQHVFVIDDRYFDEQNQLEQSFLR